MVLCVEEVNSTLKVQIKLYSELRKAQKPQCRNLANFTGVKYGLFNKWKEIKRKLTDKLLKTGRDERPAGLRPVISLSQFLHQVSNQWKPVAGHFIAQLSSTTENI